jgi:hypothetical protein
MLMCPAVKPDAPEAPRVVGGGGDRLGGGLDRERAVEGQHHAPEHAACIAPAADAADRADAVGRAVGVDGERGAGRDLDEARAARDRQRRGAGGVVDRDLAADGRHGERARGRQVRTAEHAMLAILRGGERHIARPEVDGQHLGHGAGHDEAAHAAGQGGDADLRRREPGAGAERRDDGGERHRVAALPQHQQPAVGGEREVESGPDGRVPDEGVVDRQVHCDGLERRASAGVDHHHLGGPGPVERRDAAENALRAGPRRGQEVVDVSPPRNRAVRPQLAERGLDRRARLHGEDQRAVRPSTISPPTATSPRRSAGPKAARGHIVTVQGNAVVPVDLEFIGDWLRLLLGPPASSGANPDVVHSFVSGASPLPSNSIELAYPDVPNFDVIAGVRADTCEIDVSPSGAATATFGLIGQGSTRSASSSAGTPTTRGYTAFNKAQGSIRRNGAALAQITGGQINYSNGIEIVRTIRDDLRIEGVDPGLARATDQITSRFENTLLLDDAASNAALEVTFEYRISTTRRLTVTLHQAYLSLAKTPIQGPAGIEAAFEFRAAFNAAAGRMMTVTLRNGVASYA